MSIWAQIGTNRVEEIPPDGRTSVTIYAEFTFADSPIPEGSQVKFVVGKGELPVTASDEEARKLWTEEEILASVTPVPGISMAGAEDGILTSIVGSQVIRGDDGKLAVRAVASASLLPVFDPLDDTLAVIAYSDFDKSGTVSRLQPQQVILSVTQEAKGTYLSGVERFDSTAGTWEEVAPMATGRAGAFAAGSGSKLYVIGGYNGSFTGAAEEYDPGADEWTTLAPLPLPRGYGMTAEISGKVYVVGGYNLDPGRASDAVHVLDTALGTWSQAAPMPIPVAFGAARVIGGKIYVLTGGSSFSTKSQAKGDGSVGGNNEKIDRFNPAVMVYDPGADSWSFLDVVVASPVTTVLTAAAPVGTFSLSVPGNLPLPPYGMVTLDRAGGKEVVFYESYSSIDAALLLSSPLQNSHAAGTTVHGSSFPENLVAANSSIDGAEIKLFGGRRYLGSTSASASLLKSTVVVLDASSGSTSTVSSGPGLEVYKAGQADISGTTYFFGGSSESSDWQNKTQGFDPLTDAFSGPTGLGKMNVMRHSMASGSIGLHAYAAGGAGSGHPPGWLRMTMSADPNAVRADGRSTASISVEATDAAGDPPDDGTVVRVTGFIFMQLTQEEMDEAAAEQAAASGGAVESVSGESAANPPAPKISILPVLFSARDIPMIGGLGATILLERSEDPIREVSNLFDFVRSGETTLTQDQLKKDVAGDPRNKTIRVGERRQLYDIAVEATVVDDFYSGTTDTDGTIAGVPDRGLASSSFSFSPPPAKQGLSASVGFYSDIASIPDAQIAEEEASADDVKSELDRIRDEEIPFGASPFYDALNAGASARDATAGATNIMVATSDNDESFSSVGPADVVETANSVSGALRFPVFVTTFVVTDPVSLSARRSRTDSADLELISSETGGNSFSVVDASYVQFVIDGIKTSAPSSIGSGTASLTKDFDGFLRSIHYVVNDLAITGNSAEMRVEHSLDGYNYEEIDAVVPPNVTFVLPTPVRTRHVRYTVRLETKSFQSPALDSVSLDFIRPNVQFLFTFPQQVSGQVSELAGASNARLPSGGTVEMGLAHGESFMFDRDYGNEPTQPVINDRGVIMVVNRSFDTFLGNNSTQDRLDSDDQIVYKSRSGPWPQEADVRVFVNLFESPPGDYLASPDRGVVAFRKKLSPNDEVTIEVILPASFRVGLKVTNPATMTGLLDSFAYMWGTTQDQSGIQINRAPRAVNAFASPSPALPGGPLEARYTFVDPDGDEEDVTKSVLTWYRNGAPIPELSNKRSISNSDILAKRADAGVAKTGKDDGLISRGSEWFFTLRPNDGQAFGPLVVSPKVTIANVPPLATGVQLRSSNQDPSVFSSSDTVRAEFEFSDVDGDEASGTIYAWFANGIEVKTGTDATLAPDDTFNDQKILAPGASIRVDVTPSDGDEFGQAAASESVLITGSTPTVDKVSLLPAKPTAVSTLRLSYAFTDVDGLADQSRISWFRNGSAVSSLDNENSISTLLLAPGQQWYAVVTPFNGSTEGTSIKSNVVVIQF